MNIAQVSIELVLAGILALCAFVLPVWNGSNVNAGILQSEALIGILGIAYLLGVIFDKLSDAILGPRETWMRLEQADKYLKKNRNYKGKDGFPQKELEFLLKREKDGRLEWMDSLKSRIRTSRELAVLGLPAIAGILIHNKVTSKCSATCPEQWVYIFVAINLILFISPIWTEAKASEDNTDNKKKENKAIKTHHLSRNPDERAVQMEQAKQQTRAAFIPYILLVTNSILAIIVIWLYHPKDMEIVLIGAGGTIITLLALWTTLRISQTYMKFIVLAMPEYLAEKNEK